MSGRVMDGVSAAGERIAERVAARRRDGIAAAFEDAGGVSVGVAGEDVVASGRRLRARRIADPMLRYAGAGR